MRFFLNVRTNNTLLVDEKGGEFADLSAACQHAMRIALTQFVARELRFNLNPGVLVGNRAKVDDARRSRRYR